MLNNSLLTNNTLKISVEYLNAIKMHIEQVFAIE